MTRTRVVVVDDSALVRSLLSEIINRQPDMECVGVAADPLRGARDDPQPQPRRDHARRRDAAHGRLDFLAKLMRLRPMPVVMVSTLTERGAEVTLRALELGAVDFVAKPKIGVADGLRQLADDITDKIRAAARARIRRAAHAAPAAGPPAPLAPAGTPRPLGRLSTEKIVFIGASTGGTEATKDVLDATAGRLARGGDHAAHAARLHDQLCTAPGRAVPHPREGGGATASGCCPATPTSRRAACT